MTPIENAYRLWIQSIQDLNDLQQFFDAKYLNDQFYRKLLVRNIFSVIESYLFITRQLIKLKALNNLNDQNCNLTYEELAILNEKVVTLTDKGETKTNDTFYSFEPSLRFTLNCFAKIFNLDKPDYGDNGFEKLKRMSKRRNDLTHPKIAEKQIVTDEEVQDLVSGLQWFMMMNGKISTRLKF